MFGFASLLEQGPLGFVARAAEDTLVLRFGAEVIRPVLERPAAARFIARSMNKGVRLLAGHDEQPAPSPGGRQVRELIRASPLLCPPSMNVQEAAQGMVDAAVTCAVVDLGDRLGIVTDRDIRTRVVATGAGPETPISEVMSAPAWTVASDSTGTEALLTMLDHGVRHLPVLDPGRRLIGVLDDVDLMASERRAPFRLRATIARSGDADAVARAASELPETIIALQDAGLPTAAVSRAIASIHDSVTTRLIDLRHTELRPPPVPFTWLAMGSFGRFEPFPSSDVDCALAWEGPDDDDLLERDAGAGGRGSRRDGERRVFGPTPTARWPRRRLFARSIEAWEQAARAWVEQPDRRRGLMLLSVVVESNAVWGATAAADRIGAAFAHAADREPRSSAWLRPLSSSGRRRASGGTSSFTRVASARVSWTSSGADFTRSSGWPAGVGSRRASARHRTRARIEASEAAGTLDPGGRDPARDAYELVCACGWSTRSSSCAAAAPDDLIDPREPGPAHPHVPQGGFPGVARVQRGIRLKLGFAAR